jgi:hypothetical protein
LREKNTSALRSWKMTMIGLLSFSQGRSLTAIEEKHFKEAIRKF